MVLDDFADLQFPIVIKMDIEGMELQALRAGGKLLGRPDTELYVCLYHHQDDEDLIVPFLKQAGFNRFEMSPKYIYYSLGGEKPGFRHGVLHAWKEDYAE